MLPGSELPSTCCVFHVAEFVGWLSVGFTFYLSRIFAGFRGFVWLDLDRHHDVVALLVEFEHELDIGDFVRNAKIDGSGGAEKIHRLEGIGVPRINVSEV